MAELKFIESIMIWSAAGFGFLSGTFADKFGVKPIMLTGLLLFSSLYFIFVDVRVCIPISKFLTQSHTITLTQNTLKDKKTLKNTQLTKQTKTILKISLIFQEERCLHN